MNGQKRMVSVAFALLSCYFDQYGAEETSVRAYERPNVEVIYAHDMGWGDVNAYNPQSEIPTPYLDALAADGMMFTDVHTSSAVCTT